MESQNKNYTNFLFKIIGENPDKDISVCQKMASQLYFDQIHDKNIDYNFYPNDSDAIKTLFIEELFSKNFDEKKLLQIANKLSKYDFQIYLKNKSYHVDDLDEPYINVPRITPISLAVRKNNLEAARFILNLTNK